MKKLAFFTIAAAACAAAPCALAQSAGERRVIEQLPNAVREALQSAEGAGLRDLLRTGHEIIHIDAPAGNGAARFILRKGEKIYSCEPLVFREGNASGAAGVRVIDQPCIDLTP